MLGGLALAMAPDVPETTRIPRPPRGREEAPAQIARLLEAGVLKVNVAREFALADAAAAHAFSETGRARGKIILRVA
jgi:starvation-inducible DNA-binding protein